MHKSLSKCVAIPNICPDQFLLDTKDRLSVLFEGKGRSIDGPVPLSIGATDYDFSELPVADSMVVRHTYFPTPAGCYQQSRDTL